MKQLALFESAPRVSFDEATVGLIAKLFGETTSLSVVGALLKTKGLHHSAGSWEQLFEKRIKPALGAGTLAMPELKRWLAQAEEFGRCHSFLYRAKATVARDLLHEDKVHAAATKNGVARLITNPLVLDQPDRPTIADVRYDDDPRGRSLVVKVVEKREERTFVGERVEGDRVIKEWTRKDARAVNVARLYPSGIFEIRVQSHWSSVNYENDVARVWRMVSDFFPPANFSPLSLAPAKKDLWDRKDQLKKAVRFSDSTMRNHNGTTLTAATGEEQSDLLEDTGAKASVDMFLSHGAYWDGSNVWWLKRDESEVPSKDIHVLLSGKTNEFAVTANCTKRDFEYVFDQLLAALG